MHYYFEEIDYTKAVYRRNNYGQPCIWYAEESDISDSRILVYSGIVDKTITKDIFNTTRLPKEEIISRYNAKLKTGYKYLSEIRDSVELPRREELYNWLNKYLPYDRTTSEGALLPMLAKVYDNKNNKLFSKGQEYQGQWKINGLRCFIRAEESKDLFHNYRLTFQSREGTFWNSLGKLEEQLLERLPENFLKLMCYEHYILDGEVYIPGYSVNEINHAVKNPNCFENSLVQYWCYDIAIPELSAKERHRILDVVLHNYIYNFRDKELHLAHRKCFVVLPSFYINNDEEALLYRNKFIDYGFEGLILRNTDSEYQFGKRNSSMIKYKGITDGIFTIIDIYPEGNKRTDIPLFKCLNDINNETFECHIGGSFEEQKKYLDNRDSYIGKKLYITFGERSGVNQVPFHIKEVKLYNEE